MVTISYFPTIIIANWLAAAAAAFRHRATQKTHI